MEQARKLSELIGEYLKKNQRLKWATQDWTRIAWSKLMKLFGDIEVSAINHIDAEDFIESLYGENLSANSIRSYVNAVRSVLNWSWRRGYRQGDPFENIKLPKAPRFEIRVFDNAELCDILASAETNMWQARILTAVTAGLRRSEVLNLTIKDIDFDRMEIAVQAKKDMADTWEWSAKGYDCRRLPLTENLANLYTKIMSELPAGYPYLHLTEKRYFDLQQMRAKGKMHPRLRVCPDENFYKPFRRILDSAKIKNGCFHDLRKTAITQWLISGISPHEVRVLAGHADISTTMSYYAACRPDLVDRARQAAIV